MSRKSSFGWGKSKLVRVAVATAVLVSIQVPTAIAGSASYTGPLEGSENGSVSFTIVKRHGKTTIKKIKVVNAAAHCTEGDFFLNTDFTGSAKVKHNRFKVVSTEEDHKVSFQGKLIKHGKKAKGTYVFTGFEPGSDTSSGCTTDELAWSAAR